MGNDNTAVGGFALPLNTEGDNNTAIGTFALTNSTGSGNTALGRSAGAHMTTADNVISIGSPGDETAFTIGDRCFIGNIRGVTVGNGDGVNVIIDSDGQLGTVNSSRRFKRDIKSMDQTSEAILALKPVTFHYKNQDTKGGKYASIRFDRGRSGCGESRPGGTRQSKENRTPCATTR